jgi:hypothetical protein
VRRDPVAVPVSHTSDLFVTLSSKSYLALELEHVVAATDVSQNLLGLGWPYGLLLQWWMYTWTRLMQLFRWFELSSQDFAGDRGIKERERGRNPFVLGSEGNSK